MKQCAILLLAVWSGVAISDATLTDDINDFVALFPTDTTISDIIVNYLTNDVEIKEAIEYFESLDFESYIDSLTNLEEFEAVINFIQDAGLDTSVAINGMSRILGISNLIIAWSFEEKSSKVIISGGFEGFFRDILAAFPNESIADLREKKLISSTFFVNFVEMITSHEFHDRIESFQATKEYQELFQLISPGLNLFKFVNLFASTIGLGSEDVAYEL